MLKDEIRGFTGVRGDEPFFSISNAYDSKKELLPLANHMPAVGPPICISLFFALIDNS